MDTTEAKERSSSQARAPRFLAQGGANFHRQLAGEPYAEFRAAKTLPFWNRLK